METHNLFTSLQYAVSPVILISACGLLLLSMTNRLGRVIDRTRMLNRESQRNRASQIKILVSRAKLIRSSILYIAICIFITAFLILLLFVSSFLSFDATMLITMLFVISVICLCISLVYFMADIFSSLRAMEADLQGAYEPTSRE